MILWRQLLAAAADLLMLLMALTDLSLPAVEAIVRVLVEVAEVFYPAPVAAAAADSIRMEPMALRVMVELPLLVEEQDLLPEDLVVAVARQILAIMWPAVAAAIRAVQVAELVHLRQLRVAAVLTISDQTKLI